MLTGPELGAAIEAARIAKGVSKKKIADDFFVKPPSIQGWVKTGRIDKSKLMDVINYFGDVVGPEHWGLRPGFSFENLPEDPLSSETADALEPNTPSRSTSDLVRQMLSKVKGLSNEARDRIVAAAEEPEKEPASYLPANMEGLRPKKDEILIPQYDVRGAMGNGQVPPDYNEAIRNLVVREELLREKGVSYTSNSALAMVTGWGQSMEGTIEDKDPVIVDRGITEYAGEGVYLLNWHDELFIKRLQRKDEDHLWLISDNKHYEKLAARIDDVTIRAKVLMVWNARKV
ncbi:helix-turn-helix transcriptional regulator [Pseudomonas fluorescens]|uniref:Peptidase S24/S26A/S26B/S26C domain-containing protein n=1 Tax=Pseudomonas fluorescens TaxID=294 RepID=A0A5E7E604_PSEFL|nr:S24 family peptidase [Pseudomonas fluorescens]VVO22013.1 hypothetical protein PS723_04287 [Pseudomonas fluorescens]